MTDTDATSAVYELLTTEAGADIILLVAIHANGHTEVYGQKITDELALGLMEGVTSAFRGDMEAGVCGKADPSDQFICRLRAGHEPAYTHNAGLTQWSEFPREVPRETEPVTIP